VRRALLRAPVPCIGSTPQRSDGRRAADPDPAARAGGERLGGIVRAYSVTAATLASLAAIAGLREVTGLTRLSAVGVMDVGSVGAWNSLAAASFGAFVPFFLGGLTILSIGPATRILVDEIRQQLSQNVLAGRHSLAELQSVFYPDRLATAPFLGTRKGMWLQLSACVLFPACVGFAAGPRALVAFCTGGAPPPPPRAQPPRSARAWPDPAVVTAA